MILVIDTSSAGIQLLLGDSFKKFETEKQSLSLPVLTEQFLNENNVKWSELSAIGIVVGPGSFTGIRLGIAYAKGLAIGLNIPVVPVNVFEIYFEKYPDAFIALTSGRSDFFVAAPDIEPCTMEIEELEVKQMDYPQTVGHIPFELKDAMPIIQRKLQSELEPVIPLYMRPSYAELNCKC